MSTVMKERPILFSAPMVRALLDSNKTQTRRVLKHQPGDHHWKMFSEYALKVTQMVNSDGKVCVRFSHSIPHNPHEDRDPCWNACPYGLPGDRLWVRENGWERPDLSPRDLREGADTWPPYEYDAEPLMCWEDGELKRYGWKRRPSIHMPRWASRINLEVTGVRVERLQDISEADARAEGARECDPVSGREVLLAGASQRGSFVLHYRHIWEQINGAGSWAANPWVWVIEFRHAIAAAGRIGAAHHADAPRELATAEPTP